MISPELLRRYPFFGRYNEKQLHEIAMISEEGSAEAGITLFKEGDPANYFYLLLDGNVDLYFSSKESSSSKPVKEFLVGEINPGEVFSISAVIEPHVLSATGRTSQPCRFIMIDALKLRDLFEKDPRLACTTVQQAAKVLMERLDYTRIQLAAAWA